MDSGTARDKNVSLLIYGTPSTTYLLSIKYAFLPSDGPMFILIDLELFGETVVC